MRALIHLAFVAIIAIIAIIAIGPNPQFSKLSLPISTSHQVSVSAS